MAIIKAAGSRKGRRDRVNPDPGALEAAYSLAEPVRVTLAFLVA